MLLGQEKNVDRAIGVASGQVSAVRREGDGVDGARQPSIPEHFLGGPVSKNYLAAVPRFGLCPTGRRKGDSLDRALVFLKDFPAASP